MKLTHIQVENMTRTVLEEVFNLHLSKSELMPYVIRIYKQIEKLKLDET